ncbi:hypothetical protein CN167_11690 [Sinorhizobium medicae]|nr:hypothetical protein CN167_11690 [Sinorhizobium medicae]
MVRACRVPPRQTVIGFLCLLFVLIIPTVETCSAEIIGRVPRVLILYPYDERLPATTFAGETARARLLESTEGLVDLFSEFLDLSRFPEKVHIDRMARYLGEKYGVSPLLIDHPQAVDSQTDWEFSVAPYPLTAGYRAAGPDP